MDLTEILIEEAVESIVNGRQTSAEILSIAVDIMLENLLIEQ